MKISIKLDADRNIVGINNTNDSAAEAQSKIKGWLLVQNDPAFSIENKELWTVRESDNVLVHISTGKTPDEETKDAIAELTKQNLQLTQDSQNYKSAITALTQQIANLQLANTSKEETTK